MHKLIYNHLEFTALLASQQWGFRTKRSAVPALIDVTHHWFHSLDKGKEICTVAFSSICVRHLTLFRIDCSSKR